MIKHLYLCHPHLYLRKSPSRVPLGRSHCLAEEATLFPSWKLKLHPEPELPAGWTFVL